MKRFTIEFPVEERHPDCWEVSVDALLERIDGTNGEEFEYERRMERITWTQPRSGRMLTFEPDERNFLASMCISVSSESDPMLDWVKRFCERHGWRLVLNDA